MEAYLPEVYWGMFSGSIPQWEWRKVLACHADATGAIPTFMGSPGAGMDLETLSALKQGYPLTYQLLDLGFLGEQCDFGQGNSLLLREVPERDLASICYPSAPSS